MAGYGPMIGKGVKLAAKYGPQAKVAWDVAGPAIKNAASTQADAMSHRKKAFAKAGTVVDGAVWQLRHHDQRVFVVLSGDKPVDSFPAIDPAALEELTRDADRSTIVTHAAWSEKRPAVRAKRAGRAVAEKAPVPGRKKT